MQSSHRIGSHCHRLIDADEQRSNPVEKDGILGITASSAALVVAQQEADFALTTDHLSGTRVSHANTVTVTCTVFCAQFMAL